MRAQAAIVAELVDGRTEIVGRRAEAPLAIRRCDGRVLLAATAAAPVGGDELALDVRVDVGARVDVGTVAATMVWPGPDGARSTMATTCTVGDDGQLLLHPEPTIVVAGARHRVSTVVRLAPTARCTIVEELSLGRSGEPSGDIDLELRVERAGAPLVHHAERFGPSSPGVGTSVSVGGARFVVSMVVVGPPVDGPRTTIAATGAAAWLPLADDAAMLLAVGTDRPAAWAAADAVRDEQTPDSGMTEASRRDAVAPGGARHGRAMV
jgi:urease accessory protein